MFRKRRDPRKKFKPEPAGVNDSWGEKRRITGKGNEIKLPGVIREYVLELHLGPGAKLDACWGLRGLSKIQYRAPYCIEELNC